MRITADSDVCIGAGQCVLTLPSVFDQSDEGTVVLLKTEPDADEEKRAREAVRLCPSGAITIEDD